MTTAVAVLGGAVALTFLWFLYEIVRLEGFPGRKWHHAYVAIVAALVVWFAPVWAIRVALGLLLAAGLLLAFPSRYDSKKERAHWSAIVTMVALLGVAVFAPLSIVEPALLAVAVYLIVDDANQHRTHNRLKREGKDPSTWQTSWLHRRYEFVAREMTT